MDPFCWVDCIYLYYYCGIPYFWAVLCFTSTEIFPSSTEIHSNTGLIECCHGHGIDWKNLAVCGNRQQTSISCLDFGGVTSLYLSKLSFLTRISRRSHLRSLNFCLTLGFFFISRLRKVSHKSGNINAIHPGNYPIIVL